ncbi:MAG: VWA domain-containing protein [Treponema sp.]|nr:VWA domain-containing protein [Treponema sp.]
MSITVTHPEIFLALTPLVPALIYTLSKYRRIILTMAENNSIQRGSKSFAGMTRAFFLRTLCRTLSWCALVCAWAEISWGSSAVPVQKSGRSVAMVFDISYSMQATDAPLGMTRLESAASYAQELLEHMQESSVAVVLAKGQGIVAVPLTDDTQAVLSLLDSLSPHLMTSAGSSLGGGIQAAITAFPPQSAQAQFIWLFTDGEETDDSLLSSITEAMSYGIPVAIIGFGSERESEVLAGDGRTRVRTALRSNRIEKTIAQAQKKNPRAHGMTPPVIYVDASEPGSAYKLLDMLSLKNGSTVISYETQKINRSPIFILTALVLFMLSFMAGELNPMGIRKITLTGSALCVLLLTGCSERFDSGKEIFSGRLEWNRQNYPMAAAHFLKALTSAQEHGDAYIKQYALYALAATYQMQGENEAALERFSQIEDDAPPALKFAVLYNSGIIAHQGGEYERAAQFFKEALLIDGTNINAKINMELSLQEFIAHQNSSAPVTSPVQENSDEQTLENAIYSVLKENDKNQWKNQEQEPEPSARDY